jgi:uncharacterized protein (TIGR02246 family)
VLQLEQAPRYETFVRTYAYPTGAAYGALLDALAPGWTRRLRGTEAFGELLASAAAIGPAAEPAVAAGRYGGADLLAGERVRERERAARVADYTRRFVEEPVLILPRTNRSSSTTSGLTPLGEHGTIVRGFRTDAPWGRFEADAVLRAPDYGTYAVPAPLDTAGRVLTGPGWRLDLASGWAVAPGPRRGDFRVVPEPSLPVVATLRRMRDAVNSGDARAYAATYASDASLTIYGGARLQGRAAIEEYELGLLRAHPRTRFELSAIWVHGSDVVARYGVVTPPGAGPATGHEGLLFLRFDEQGAITAERRYLDSLTPMAQAGLLRGAAARDLPTLAADPRIAVAGPAQNGSNRAAVAAILAALDSGDAASLLPLVHDDVALDEVMLARAFAGKSGALAWLRTWQEAVSDRRTELVRAIEVGDFVLAEMIAHGRLNGSIGALAPAGKPFAVHRAAIVEFRGGLIGGITVFTNGRELAEQTGQWPPGTSR